MAIYHCSTKVIGRSGGRSAIAAAAYRAGEQIKDVRSGRTHEYSRKRDVDHAEIIAPENAPEWASDRQRRCISMPQTHQASRQIPANTASQAGVLSCP